MLSAAWAIERFDHYPNNVPHPLYRNIVFAQGYAAAASDAHRRRKGAIAYECIQRHPAPRDRRHSLQRDRIGAPAPTGKPMDRCPPRGGVDATNRMRSRQHAWALRICFRKSRVRQCMHHAVGSRDETSTITHCRCGYRGPHSGRPHLTAAIVIKASGANARPSLPVPHPLPACAGAAEEARSSRYAQGTTVTSHEGPCLQSGCRTSQQAPRCGQVRHSGQTLPRLRANASRHAASA